MGSYPTVPLYHEVFPAWCLNFPGAMATQWQCNGNTQNEGQCEERCCLCTMMSLFVSLLSSSLPFLSLLFSSRLFFSSLSLSVFVAMHNAGKN